MQFCTDCGSVLNLFEFPDEELCFSCRKSIEKKEVPPSPQPAPTLNVSSLADAVLSHENGQIVLKSPEGWILWSVAETGSSTMDKIVKRAERILEIRQKRFKSKN